VRSRWRVACVGIVGLGLAALFGWRNWPRSESSSSQALNEYLASFPGFVPHRTYGDHAARRLPIGPELRSEDGCPVGRLALRLPEGFTRDSDSTANGGQCDLIVGAPGSFGRPSINGNRCDMFSNFDENKDGVPVELYVQVWCGLT
jgi:hypothetical protein